jgi:hypothetical protein
MYFSFLLLQPNPERGGEAMLNWDWDSKPALGAHDL